MFLQGNRQVDNSIAKGTVMYHRFANPRAKSREVTPTNLKPGDRAECGWIVTQEWLDAESLPFTMENTCMFCYNGTKRVSEDQG